MTTVTNNNNNKPLCVICKIPLLHSAADPNSFKCSKCHNTYTLYYEIMEYEDDFETIHEDEAETIELAGLDAGGTGLESSSDDDNEVFNLKSIEEQIVSEREEQQEKVEGSIKRPPYMKGSNVIFYQKEDLHNDSTTTMTNKE